MCWTASEWVTIRWWMSWPQFRLQRRVGLILRRYHLVREQRERQRLSSSERDAVLALLGFLMCRNQTRFTSHYSQASGAPQTQ